MNITDNILPEPFCHEQKIFKWMRENVGFKHIHWNSRITIAKVNGARQLQFDIYDDGVRAIFKLTFSENFTKIDVEQYFKVFFIPSYEQVRLRRLLNE
jgi:hypothetical protein